MEPMNFDFNALLKKHQKSYKNKPMNLSSVAGGTTKRLEANLKKRRSSRMTIFDKIRDLPKCDTPVKKPDVLTKVEQRRLQLEKWKMEKEMKKKEAAKSKPKPFIAGIAHAPLKYEPPPPLKMSKPVPSTSGMVTRSQAARCKKQKAEIPSFAPKNATFKAPVFKNPNIPVLTLPKSRDRKKIDITFNPVLPGAKEASKLSNSESRIYKKKNSKTKDNTLLRETRSSRFTQYSTQSSSSSNSTESVQNESRMALQSSSSSEFEKMSTNSEIEKMSSSFKLKNMSSSNKLKNMSSSNESEVSSNNELEKLTSGSESEKVSKSAAKFRNSRKSISKESTPKIKSSSDTCDSGTNTTPGKSVDEPKRLSPCVTLSRGKDNARREMKKKLEEGLLDEDLSKMDSVDDFRRQLASEIERITELCVAWDKVLEQTQLPDTVQEYVLGAVGQARLLMSQKLQQFASLVERCAAPEPGTALVTPADLQGFWDMVFMQVENVYMRFKKLDELRDRGWAEDMPVELKKKAAGKPNLKKTKTSAAPSRLKEMIAAARKAKKAQEAETLTSSPSVTSSDSESKTFEAGFFCVKSPVKSSAVSTPSKPSLLKAVLSNEAKKASVSRSSASFAILRASVMSKSVEWEGVAPLPQTPLTPINLFATPGRSILKSAAKNPVQKPIKVVLFNSDDSDASKEDQPKTAQENCQVQSNIATDKEVVEVKETTGHEEENKEEKCMSDVKVLTRVSDIGVSGKENRRKSREKKLVKQEAIEADSPSPIKTRRQRRSMRTPLLDIPNERLLQSEKKVADETPRRVTRSRKSMPK